MPDGPLLAGLDRLSLGVWGYTIDQEDGSVWVPHVHADELVNLARFVEELSLDTVWVFPSPALELVPLLLERGFYQTEVWQPPPADDVYWDPELWEDDEEPEGEVISAWVRDRRGIVDVITDLL